MRRLSMVPGALGLLAVAATVAACGGGAQTQPSANAQLLRRSASWMAPHLEKRDLLYLSDDGAGNVYVYSFPGAKLQGR